MKAVRFFRESIKATVGDENPYLLLIPDALTDFDMWRPLIAVLTLATFSLGCTHKHLARSTVLTAGTVMEIQNQIVLTNLAMLSLHPESLPSHMEIDDGVVQVSDEIALGSSGGFTTFPWFHIERFGPKGRRLAAEQWGAEPTLDPERLTELQDLYRVALGLPPLSPPSSVLYLRQLRAEQAAAKTRDGASDATSSSDERKVPIDVLLSDVPPPGWYQLGSKHDVPDNACCVGRFGDRYAWVTPEGIPGMSRFTVTVLAVMKLKPGEPRRRGLAFAR